MNMKPNRPAGAAPNPDATSLRPRQADGTESPLHLPSDFDLDEAFLSEADPDAPPVADATESVLETVTEPVFEAARALGRPHPVSTTPAPSEGQDVSDPTPAFSIAELLETDVPLDWREAVSIARRMCDTIARHPAAGTQEYYLDPRHIVITEKGEIVVEPGEPGSDPFVKQVGRILRALLEGGEAPAQLRLLISQAVFDVPGFVSLEDFSAALSSFEKQAQGDAVRVAFRRVRERKYSAPPLASAPSLPVALPAASSLPAGRAGNGSAEPATLAVERSPRRVVPMRSLAAVAAMAIGAATPLVFWLNRDSYQVRIPAPQVEVLPTTLAVIPQPTLLAPSIEAVPAQPIDAIPAPLLTEPPLVTLPRPQARLPQRAPAGGTGGITEGPGRITQVPFPDAAPVMRPPGPVLPSSSAPEEPSTPRPSAIVPDAGQDRSLRTLALAFDHYNRARTALDRDDYQQALSDGDRAESLLDTLDVNVAPGELRDRLNELIARADAVRAREEARVYTTADAEVTPPVAVGRQLPSAAPASVARSTIGTLEMVIGRGGQVETLRLRTPLNRFHERMIVSAAKAWRYRPALKNGRPVRFLLVSSINLPES